LEGAFSGSLGTSPSGFLNRIKASDVGVGFDKFDLAGSDLHPVLKRDHGLTFCDGLGGRCNVESSAVGHVLAIPYQVVASQTESNVASE